MAAATLVGCGARAIPPLRSFLLAGKPRGIFQPRQLAVETLAELGAKDALIEYLSAPATINDSVVRHGEDAVRSTAARELGRWQTEDVFQCLSQAGLDHVLPGIVEALGTFKREEAVPYFLSALGDGVCRLDAEAAIRKLGERARPWLLDAVESPSPSAKEEIPSSLQRRRWALRILSDLELSDEDWARLRNLLDENDASIVITTAGVAFEIGPICDKRAAIQRLIEMLPRADWLLRSDARIALAKHFDFAQEAVEQEITRRMNLDKKSQALDVILRLLINLRAEALEMRQHATKPDRLCGSAKKGNQFDDR
ncbi:MAG: HEAT repeat domain-containing protein [Candidatus Acidiferrales bacterium]